MSATPFPSTERDDPMTTKRLSVARNYRTALAAIRGDRKLSEHGKRAAAARLYTTAKAASIEAAKEDQEARTARFNELERELWGPRPGGPLVDPAARSMALRDATERAATLTRAADARAALKRAEQNGDEALARAIARHANEREWTGVVHAFLEARPGHAELYAEACDLYHAGAGSAAAVESLSGAIRRPEELRGLDDHQVAQLATDAERIAS